MAYVPAGLLGDQIEFKPTVELWSENRPNWMQKAPSNLSVIMVVKSY